MPLSSKGYRPVSSWWSLGIIACNQVHRCEFWGPQKPPERGSSDKTWRRWRTIAIIVAPVAEFPGMLPSTPYAGARGLMDVPTDHPVDVVFP